MNTYIIHIIYSILYVYTIIFNNDNIRYVVSFIYIYIRQFGINLIWIKIYIQITKLKMLNIIPMLLNK